MFSRYWIQGTIIRNFVRLENSVCLTNADAHAYQNMYKMSSMSRKYSKMCVCHDIWIQPSWIRWSIILFGYWWFTCMDESTHTYNITSSALMIHLEYPKLHYYFLSCLEDISVKGPWIKSSITFLSYLLMIFNISLLIILSVK